jgi:poly(hydroxyalkanoate) depolymerase family esterase
MRFNCRPAISLRGILQTMIAGVALMLLAMQGAFAVTLTQVTGFGSNPGNLLMYKYVPAGVPANAPLVMLLHGCTMSAGTYDDEPGWVKYADSKKFILVFAQQQSSNHQNLCFRWFLPGHISRDQGEALSIKQMVDKMKATHSIDSSKVYVSGLSAGGAMTAVMLAAYPDVFAGGGIMSGLPYKCGLTEAEAQNPCMYPGKNQSPQQWGDLARSGYPGYGGRKPKVAIWHGDADYLVYPVNMNELMEQWTNYHGISQTPAVSDTLFGHARKIYRNGSGQDVVMTVSLKGGGHATAVDVGTAENQCGAWAGFVSDYNVCSTYWTAKFWGLF